MKEPSVLDSAYMDGSDTDPATTGDVPDDTPAKG
jgi:hypothetical protein